MNSSRVYLDPAAVQTYTAAADTLADQLRAAAATAAGVDLSGIGSALGVVGAEFAAEFTTTYAAHAGALAAVGTLLASYGQGLRAHAAGLLAVDDDTAAALTTRAEL